MRTDSLTYTYDTKEHGKLIISADDKFKAYLREMIADAEQQGDSPDGSKYAVEEIVLQALTEGELDRVQPVECGDLTDAPMGLLLFCGAVLGITSLFTAEGRKILGVIVLLAIVIGGLWLALTGLHYMWEHPLL